MTSDLLTILSTSYTFIKKNTWGVFVTALAEKAENLSDSMGLTDPGERNAVAHTLTSSSFAYHSTPGIALELGNFKELPSDDVLDSYRDQYNNEVGRRIADYVSDHYTGANPSLEMQAMVIDALQNGDLITNINVNPLSGAIDPRVGNFNADHSNLAVPTWTAPSENIDDVRDDVEDSLDAHTPVPDIGEIVHYSYFINLPDQPDPDQPPPLPDPEKMLQDLYNSLHLHGSPLVMDISGDGIALSALGGAGSVYWDINSDGQREAAGWVADGTGILCIDNNSNGTIDDNSELFGNQPSTGIANGFQALAAFDSNSDGVINASDTDFANLLVWVDENADGVSQSGELHTLSALNITSIDLSYSNVSYQINGNDIRQESTFVMDGNTRTIVDAWLQYDSMNTVHNGEVTLDPSVIDLPEQRGYGLLPNLSVAMSQDSDLLDMVSDIASKTARELFTESYDVRTKIQAIMYEWAGVTSNATDRSGFIEFTTDDTRRVDFLDAMMGSTLAGGINQEWFGRTWDSAVGIIGGNLLLQSGLNELFGGPQYSPISETWSGGNLGTDPTLFRFMPLYHYSDNLHDSGFNDIYVLTPGVTADGGFVIQEPNSQGTDTLLLGGVDAADVKLWTGSGGDIVVQYTDDDQVTISGSHDSLGRTTTGDQVEHILFDDGTLWDLTQGLVLVNDDTGRYLVGSLGNDTITGGAGNDHLRGFEGNDTYIFKVGGGADIIDNELGGTDKIVFGAGIGPEDVVIGHSGMYDMTLTYGSGDVVTVTNFMYSTDNRVESVQFTDDETVWDASYLLSHAQTVYGTSSNDSLSTFNSLATTFVGGAGDDSINGGGGAINTTYMFGSAYGGGNDTISDGGGTDTIVIDGSPSGVTYKHSGAYDLQIGYSGGTITVSYYFYASDYKVESVAFTDVGNTVHDSTYIDAQAHILTGTSSGETLSAFDSGATTFIGGAGNDSLNGHGGNDVYKFAEGDGADTISEGYSSTDKIVFDAGISASSVTYQHTGAYDLTIHYGTSGDTVTVSYFFYNSDYKIESVEFSDVGNTVHDSSYINAQVHNMHGTSGSDAIYAFDSQDTTFYGHSGDDYLQGGGGNDTFFGGDGTDLMVGSSGADTFVLEGATAFNNVDTVYDFNTTQNDALDLRDVLGGYDPMTDTLSDFVQLTTSGGSTHVFVDRDGTGSTYSSAEIVTLYGVTSLPSVDTMVTDGHLLAA